MDTASNISTATGKSIPITPIPSKLKSKTKAPKPLSTIKPISVNPVKNESEVIPSSKLTVYQCDKIPGMQQLYVKLLNDNLQYLLNFIYSKGDYQTPEVRVALAMQMLLASNQLISYPLASLIIKDIETLRHDETYLNQWDNPTLKRKCLAREIELLRKHTEIDETISLNLADQVDPDQGEDFKDFDVQSGVSTLNVSASCPVEPSAQGCNIM